MNFISRISQAVDTKQILLELTQGIEGPFDLGFLFLSGQDLGAIQELKSKITSTLKINTFLGCTCAGVIGSDNEIEGKVAHSLILAQLPDVNILPFCLKQAELETFHNKDQWYNFFEIFPHEQPIFLVLPDPFAFDIYKFIAAINQVYPSAPLVGGLASGAYSAGNNVLILNDEEFDEGLVGVALTGNIAVQTVVSQGCRPIGESFIVTKAQSQVIFELAGRPFLDVLQDVLQKVSASDKVLAQEALLVGIVMDEYKHDLKRGDFLIRGLLGVDQKTKAGVIAEYIKPGQTIQFHLRDAHSATEDLHDSLRAHKQFVEQKPKGALVFSCNGRGQNLFRQQDHDIRLIQQHLGPVPAAGFFCAGELGPVAQHNFLHGFTSSIALFYPKGVPSTIKPTTDFSKSQEIL